ncbi:MAG TPA: pseudouridine synthase [Chthoniobacteraceae bacterium]|nr:pseudouridine synthase [Chthoniobacteraceae bacterium]
MNGFSFFATFAFFAVKQSAMLIAFHKPFGVISRFTPDGSRYRTLAGFGIPRGVYPLGRLDAESEGLLLFSDEKGLNERLLHPDHAHRRTYWAQVERVPTRGLLDKMERGLVVGGRETLPCKAWLLDPQPEVAPRDPPIRFRKNVPDAWIALELIEGKNHQVRRMTAAIGHPTLRLIRVKIGDYELLPLAAGKWIEADDTGRKLIGIP